MIRPCMLAVRRCVPVLVVVLTGCSLTAESSSPADPERGTTEAGGPVVLVTHESFALPKPLIRQFEDRTGYTVDVRANGDAGTLTNKLVLTKNSPTGDLAFGVDNTFASRALEAGVFDVADVALPDGAAAYALDEGADRLVPIDNASVCVNVDTTWFRDRDLAPPTTLDDLTKPAYRDLFVTPGAPTSSPGMAFLLATVAAYGDAWPDYWTDLLANGTRITSGWSDAYYVDFTQGGGDGTRPIVLSYDSSPAFTPGTQGSSLTAALLDTCFRQVEYAGVLAGAANPDGARALLDFLLSEPVQAALPESMYVFPVRDGITLPRAWARYARQPASPYAVDPADIAAHRDEWLTTWQDVTSR